MSERRKVQYLSVIVIVALILIAIFAVSRPIAQEKSTSRTIQVSGMGTASDMPDEVLLSFAVYTQSATATQATSDNAVAMNRVIQALANVGIGRTAVSTTAYSLIPILNSSSDQKSPSTVVGYAARNSIQVTLVNVNMTGVALDAAVTAGANEVLGVTFTFTNQKYASLQKQALGLAVQDAAGQAQAMASSLGVRIIRPLTVTSGYYSQPTVQRLATSALTPIQAGTLQVTANVQVTYEVA